MLKMFLTSKVEENDEMIKFVSDPQLAEQYSQNTEGSRRGLDAEVHEQKEIFEHKFTDKYTDHHDIYIVRKYFFNKNGLGARQKRHHDEDEDHHGTNKGNETPK